MRARPLGCPGMALLRRPASPAQAHAHIRPLPAVPDMSHFYEQHKAVQPYLITAEGVDTSVENYQSKEDRSKLDGARRARISSLGSCGATRARA